MSVPNHRIGDAAHKRSPHTAKSSASYYYKPSTYLDVKLDDLLIRLSVPQIRSGYSPSSTFNMSYLLTEGLFGCTISLLY